jgi:hypothetical protein
MRIQTRFHKKIPGREDRVLEITGSLDATMEGNTLILSDARDESFRRVDISGETRILLETPIRWEEPKLRMPCGCLVDYQTNGGHVVECACRRAWAIRAFGGEVTVQEHGTWSKG